MNIKLWFTSLFGPSKAREAAAKVRGTTSLTEGIINTVVSLVILLFVSFIAQAVLYVALGAMMPDLFGGVTDMMMYIIQLLVTSVLAFIFGIIFWFVGDGIAWGIGKAFGGTASFGQFMGAISYPESGMRVINILTAIPILGMFWSFIASIWLLIQSIFVMAEIHQISAGKAFVSAFIAGIVVFFGMMIVGVITFVILGILGMATGF